MVIGCLLYYVGALDYTILVALNTLSLTQAKLTTKTKQLCNHQLNYCATYPNVGLRYQASAMILHIDSDASYLIVCKAKSRIVGYFYLNNKPSNTINNAPILVKCRTLKHVVTSSAECEIAGVFHNTKTTSPIQYILNEIGHKQPPTP